MSVDHAASSSTEADQGAAPVPARKPGVFRNKTWVEAAAEKETTARLDGLPAGLAFPPDFPEPITYDAARKLLSYRGFMCHRTYQALHELSGDAAYLAALDQLYQGSSYTTGAPSGGRRLGRWLAVAAAAALALAALWRLLG
jgi:hypothetical protein